MCPFCNSTETRWIESLGWADHAQCRDCGVVYALDAGLDELEYLEDLALGRYHEEDIG